MTVFDTVAAERLALVERLHGLTDEEWSAPSLCGGWTVHHVVAHLVTPFEISVPGLMGYVVRARSIDGAMDRIAHTIADRRDPAELLEILAANATSTFKPPGLPAAAPLTDVVCHGADIRWPLGDPLDDWGNDPERLRPSLELIAGRQPSVFVPRGRLSGLRLRATDQDWSHGDGPEVAGTSLALLTGMLGRTPAYEVLTGDGVDVLTARR